LAEYIPALLGPNKAFGAAVVVAVADRVGEQAKISHATIEEVFQRPGMRPKGRLLDRADPEDLARLLGGLAHPDRVRLAKAILAGAGSHRELDKEMEMRTGPLYHHLRELERAGILVKASRNLYTVTERGRLVLFVATVLAGFGSGARSGWRCAEIKCGRALRRRAGQSAKPNSRPKPRRTQDRRR
jgi:DNA-binding HxlR family transcriptional regulator